MYERDSFHSEERANIREQLTEPGHFPLVLEVAGSRVAAARVAPRTTETRVLAETIVNVKKTAVECYLR